MVVTADSCWWPLYAGQLLVSGGCQTQTVVLGWAGLVCVMAPNSGRHMTDPDFPRLRCVLHYIASNEGSLRFHIHRERAFSLLKAY